VFAKLPDAPKPVKTKHTSSYGNYETEESQDFLVKAKGPNLGEVEAFPYHFDFRKRIVIVNYLHYNTPGHFDFEVEEKIYSDSPHNSKLRYDGASKEEKAEQIRLINIFVDKLMEGVEPEQRFNLKDFSKIRSIQKAIDSALEKADMPQQ